MSYIQEASDDPQKLRILNINIGHFLLEQLPIRKKKISVKISFTYTSIPTALL